MKRRSVLLCISATSLQFLPKKEAKAWIPFLGWLWRASTLLRGQALRTGARTFVTNGTRKVVSAAVLANRANRASMALKSLTAFSVAAIAVDEVLAYVQGTPEDSNFRWALAYYAVLTQSDSEAAMGMWVGPTDPSHFMHLSRTRPSYRVTRLEERSGSVTRTWVLAQNSGEPQTSHVVDIGWEQTQHGKRVASFETVKA